MLELGKLNFRISGSLKLWCILWLEIEQLMDRFKESVQQRKCLLACLVFPCKISKFYHKWWDGFMLGNFRLAKLYLGKYVKALPAFMTFAYKIGKSCK